MNRVVTIALRALAVPLVALVLFAPSVAHGQMPNTATGPSLAQGNILRVAISQGGDTGVSELINLGLGKSAVVELPIDVADVLVSGPEIADAVVRSARRIYILGLSVGTTNAFFFDADGGQILNLEIRVERDIAAVQEMIDRLVPDGRIHVEALNDNIVLSGVVGSASQADRARDIAARYVEAPEQVLNAISISGGEQVLLKVRVVEMQRTIAKQLGVNLNGTTNFGEFAPPTRIPRLDGEGNPIFDQFNNPVYDTIQPGGYANSSSFGTNNAFALAGRSLGGLAAGVGADNYVDGVLQSTVDLTLNALERVGLVRTLAEPNLTAISGEAADFLAGGEFPVPAGRDSEGNVLVEYKAFGVGLSFTPVVLDEGRISLFVSTEVSELTDQGALELTSNSFVDPDSGQVITIPGLTLPGLKVRRAETTLELPSGGSMVMAGLIQDSTKQSIDGTPGAQSIPGLGALFRSRDFESEETELVVIVTPYLVTPTAESDLATPSDGFRTANDLESFFLGRLNRVYAAPGADTDGLGWRGPIGFILDDAAADDRAPAASADGGGTSAAAGAPTPSGDTEGRGVRFWRTSGDVESEGG